MLGPSDSEPILHKKVKQNLQQMKHQGSFPQQNHYM